MERVRLVGGDLADICHALVRGRCGGMFASGWLIDGARALLS
jgi:hypothetical protein